MGNLPYVNIIVNFRVVKLPFAYNAIFVRPTLRAT